MRTYAKRPYATCRPAHTAKEPLATLARQAFRRCRRLGRDSTLAACRAALCTDANRPPRFLQDITLILRAISSMPIRHNTGRLALLPAPTLHASTRMGLHANNAASTGILLPPYAFTPLDATTIYLLRHRTIKSLPCRLLSSILSRIAGHWHLHDEAVMMSLLAAAGIS